MRQLWNSITEPRHLKAVYWLIYAIALATGIAALLWPPAALEGILGAPLTILWSVFLIMGGTGGLLAVFPGWWWAERLSILFVLSGVFIYGVVLASLSMLANEPRAAQIGVLALAGSVFIVRWLLIRRYSFEPRG